MKKLLIISSILALIVFFSSCNKKVEDATFSPKELRFSREGGSDTISLTAHDKWTIAVNDNVEYVTVDKVSGDVGVNTIIVTLEENQTFEERSPSLTITQAGKRQRLNITQARTQRPTASVLTPYVMEGGTKKLSLSAQWSWKFDESTPLPDWITIDSTSGVGVDNKPVNGTVNVKVEENIGIERSFTMKFIMDSGRFSQTTLDVVVTQINKELEGIEGDWKMNFWETSEDGGEFTYQEVFIERDELEEFWGISGYFRRVGDNKPVFRFVETTTDVIDNGYTAEQISTYSLYDYIDEYPYAIVNVGEEGAGFGAIQTTDYGNLPYIIAGGFITQGGGIYTWLRQDPNYPDDPEATTTAGMPTFFKIDTANNDRIIMEDGEGFMYAIIKGGIPEPCYPAVFMVCQWPETQGQAAGWYVTGSLVIPVFHRFGDEAGMRTGNLLPEPPPATTAMRKSAPVWTKGLKAQKMKVAPGVRIFDNF